MGTKTVVAKDAALDLETTANRWASLLTTLPSDDAMTGAVESALARVQIPANTGWGASTGSGTGPRTRVTAAATTFAAAAAKIVTRGYALYDAVSAGVARRWNSWGTTALSAAMTNSQTTVPVTDGSQLPASGAYRIQIDSEFMDVTGGQGTNTLTVTRAVDGSVAATHASGAAVQRVVPIDIGVEFSFPAGQLSLSED